MVARAGVLQSVAQFCVLKKHSAQRRPLPNNSLSISSTDMLGFRQKSQHSGKRGRHSGRSQFQSLGRVFSGERLMATVKSARPEGEPLFQEKQTKKSYTKPAFRFERVFETLALSCGKVHSHFGQCKTNPKAS